MKIHPGVFWIHAKSSRDINELFCLYLVTSKLIYRLICEDVEKFKSNGTMILSTSVKYIGQQLKFGQKESKIYFFVSFLPIF